MLELGSGFAFIGRQKEIIIAGKNRKIDMLFYHIKLRCYVVVELKAVSFEPEFAGKLNFYVNAVNQLMKTDDDNPTIGLLICKDKDQTEVQWAFQGIETPMGVATYDNIWNLSEHRLQTMCNEGKISGVKKFGHAWVIPYNAEKSVDKRIKLGKYIKS